MSETISLIKLAHEGDKKARDRLVEENLGLVWSIVRRFLGRGYESEDLFQIGSIGLMKAIDKFNVDMEVKFSTYAVPMISGEIKRFLRDDGMIKVSRSIKENSWKIRRTEVLLNEKLGREPTIEEISKEAGMAVEEIVVALEASMEVESIYKPVGSGEDREIHLLDRLVEEKNSTEQCINEIVTGQLLDTLDEKERRLIELRYFQERTQTEIAASLGISQVQVSRLEKKILKKLRNLF